MNEKILILGLSSFNVESAKAISDQTGYLTILAQDVNDIRTLEPKDKETIIRWLNEDNLKSHEEELKKGL